MSASNRRACHLPRPLLEPAACQFANLSTQLHTLHSAHGTTNGRRAVILCAVQYLLQHAAAVVMVRGSEHRCMCARLQDHTLCCAFGLGIRVDCLSPV